MTMLKLVAKPVLEARGEILLKRVRRFENLHHRVPQLTVILVGEDPASVIYTRRKGQAASALSCKHQTLQFPSHTTPQEIKNTIDQLNNDPTIDGILIQRPLPPSFREEEVLNWITPSKDVDAFHPINAGRLFLGLPSMQPCTPAGVMCLLKHYQIPIASKSACVIGRSTIVGRPMAALLLQANATIIQCHSQTIDLQSYTRQADLLIVAAGKPGLIKASHVKQGAVVIDVGVHRNAAGQVMGDVCYDDVATIASAMTPVPGGVGPMTISVLMENTIWAAEQRELN